MSACGPARAAMLSVDPTDRQASVAFYQNEYAPGIGVDVAWTPGVDPCSPGTTTSAYRSAALQRVNYFRAMAGVPAVTLNATFNRRAQAAAHLISVNKAANHVPPTSWLCYSNDGAVGAGKSNLFLGRSGLAAIDGYVRDDGGGNGPVGHRRFVLHPPTQQMGVGDVLAGLTTAQANALYVIDGNLGGGHPATRDDFVAWPPPGYVPYNVAYPRWHFSQQGVDLSSASVSLTLDGQSVPATIEGRGDEYGLDYLSWRVNNMPYGSGFPRPTTDQRYVVTISNARVNGQNRTIRYDVTLIDPVSIPGDFNYDGAVDAADYTVVRDGLGAGFDDSDLAEWRVAYGDTSPATSEAVPEPSAVWLGVAGVLAASPLPLAIRGRAELI